MPRQSAVSVDNNFKQGLITEASGLNFPENACTDTFNCEFEITGEVNRRLGIDFEVNFQTKTIARSSSAIVTYLWKNPNGESSLNLLAAQIGSTLYFWDCGAGTTPISSTPIAANITLSTFTPAGGSSPDGNECQFATGNGKLFVTHPLLEAFYVVYNSTAQTLATTQINPMIRDFEGRDDGLAINARPTMTVAGGTATHLYNLYNQGWQTVDSAGATTITNLAAWDTAFTTLPSNVDVMWSFKNTSDAFDTTTVPNVINGNSPAPKGHFILNLYNQDRSTASGVGGLTAVTTSNNRCSTVAFFAGRTWFSGLGYTGFNNNIYFSQIVESDTQYGYCYQTNDPTAENLFDLLPSDGGVISIRDAGTIIKLVAVQSGLAVFATNGIWFITGSQGVGFTATDYSVIKLSSVPALTASSFVDVQGFPAWWNLDGIYVLGGSEGGTGLTAQSLTFTTIQSFYQELPPATKRNCKGFYNRITGVIQWLYTSATVATIDEQYNFDRILAFNTITKAFYPWSFSNTHDVKINGLIVIEGSSGLTLTNQVIDTALDIVIDDSGNNVVTYELGNTVTSPSFLYLVSYNDGSNKFTIAQTSNTSYVDWASYTSSANYTSYFISGYKIRGEGIRDFQSNYVEFFADNNSKFTVQGVWDYAANANSVRWSTAQSIDTTNNANFNFISKRRKIRGRGKTVQIKVDSVAGYPFNILGWSMLASANPTP